MEDITMSHIIKLYWAIVDQNGNSIDNVNYHSAEEANAVMATLLVADPSLILSVTQLEQIII